MAGASGIRAGKAFVELSTRDKLTKGLLRAQAQLKAFGAGASKIGVGMVGIGAAVAGPLALATKSFISQGDQVQKMAIRTGLAAEAVSELGYAAEQSGSNIETLEKGVRKMQQSITDAGRGLSTAVDGLEEMGLSADQLEGKSVEEQLNLIADGIASIDDPTRRAAAAMKILGRAGTQLIPLMEGGAAGMAELRDQARALGLTISGEAADNAAKLGDEVNDLRRVLKATVFTIGSALFPVVSDLVRAATEGAVVVARLVDRNRELFVVAAKVAVVVAAAGAALLVLGTSSILLGSILGLLASAISAVPVALGAAGAALAWILSPIVLVTAAVAGMGAAIVTYSGLGGEALRWLGDQFGSLLERWRPVVDAIRDSLSGGDITGAAKVLWAGLKVEWEKGSMALQAVWLGVKTQFLTLASKMGFGLQAAMEIGLHAVETAWIRTIGFLGNTWDRLIARLKSGWESLTTATAKGILDFQARVDPNFSKEDAAAGKKLLDEQLADRKSQIDADAQKSIEERDARRNTKLKAADEKHREVLAGIVSDADKAAAKIAADGAASLLEAQKALREAEAELAAAIAAAQSPGGDGTPGALGTLADRLQALLDGVGGAMDGASSAGTFSASAVADLGNRRLDRLVEATETVADNTTKLVRNSRSGGLTFS